MSAVLRAPQRLTVPMREGQIDAALAIERAAYDFPWSRGNFTDSLTSGYPMHMLFAEPDLTGAPVGYFVAMDGVDEMHLLNIAVHPHAQGRGHALFMLDRLCALARQRRAQLLWLEVRAGNARARAVYARYGFRHIGDRRGYYPAHGGEREDAVVMSLRLSTDSQAPQVE